MSRVPSGDLVTRLVVEDAGSREILKWINTMDTASVRTKKAANVIGRDLSSAFNESTKRAATQDRIMQRQIRTREKAAQASRFNFGQRALGASSLLFGISQELGFSGLNIGFAALAGPGFAAAAAASTAIGGIAKSIAGLSEEAEKAADSLKATSVALSQANRERERNLALLGAEIQDAKARGLNTTVSRAEREAALVGANISGLGGAFSRSGSRLFGNLIIGLSELVTLGGFEGTPPGPSFRQRRLSAIQQEQLTGFQDELETLELTHDALENIVASSSGIVRARAAQELEKVHEELEKISDPAKVERMKQFEQAIKRFTEPTIADSLKALTAAFSRGGVGLESFGGKRSGLILGEFAGLLEDNTLTLEKLENRRQDILLQLRNAGVSAREINGLFDRAASELEDQKLTKAIERFTKEIDPLSELFSSMVERAESLRDEAFPEESFSKRMEDILFAVEESILSREGARRLLARDAADLRLEDEGFESRSSSLGGFFERRFSAALSREPEEPKLLKDIEEEIRDAKTKAVTAAAEELGVSREIRDILRGGVVGVFGP